jgi:sugar lactone lactonase YvrE
LNGVGAVSRVSKAGGAVEVLASGEAQPTQLALDETHVYWTNQGNPGLAGVRRMAKQGGAPELFAPGESPMGVAVDATHVYWCDWGAGKVQRRSKTGGVVQVLAPSEPDANRIALDAQRVYWSSADHIASVAKTGGPVTILSPTFNAQDVATDGEGVYWTTNFEVERWKQGPLRLVGGGNVHELEVRGPWVYYVNAAACCAWRSDNGDHGVGSFSAASQSCRARAKLARASAFSRADWLRTEAQPSLGLRLASTPAAVARTRPSRAPSSTGLTATTSPAGSSRAPAARSALMRTMAFSDSFWAMVSTSFEARGEPTTASAESARARRVGSFFGSWAISSSTAAPSGPSARHCSGRTGVSMLSR